MQILPATHEKHFVIGCQVLNCRICLHNVQINRTCKKLILLFLNSFKDVAILNLS